MSIVVNEEQFEDNDLLEGEVFSDMSEEDNSDESLDTLENIKIHIWP